MTSKNKAITSEFKPDVEFQVLLQEAMAGIENELQIEDKGWIRLGNIFETMTVQQRIDYVKQSRVYFDRDPLGKQAIRLWTDYAFSTGMTWTAKDVGVGELLNKKYWNDPLNRPILGARGQRKSSDKLLVDGEIFFALFLGAGGQVRIRRIDPLEITEIITDPEDYETPLYYKRSWFSLASAKTSIYPSVNNRRKKKIAKDFSGAKVTGTEENVVVYHLAFNSIGQRGLPLLTPALDWIKQYRRFLASRVAIMLALSRFAWKSKILGGASAVSGVKTSVDGKTPAAGAWMIENAGIDTQPIRTDSGSKQAYDDGRMLRLQVAAAAGFGEQYFGDIATGNLATAKTVELPMMKMFESYQQVWRDTYKDLDEIVLEHNSIDSAKWYIDRDFPSIIPQDIFSIGQALPQLLGVFPEFAESSDVKQQALIAMGINDPDKVLEQLKPKTPQQEASVTLIKALQGFKEAIRDEYKNKV